MVFKQKIGTQSSLHYMFFFVLTKDDNESVPSARLDRRVHKPTTHVPLPLHLPRTSTYRHLSRRETNFCQL